MNRKIEQVAGFAVPGKLVVGCVFMIQFMALIMGLGMLGPYFHERGVHYLIIGIGALTAFAVVQVVLGLGLKLVPVRCLRCRGRSRFLGFSWWPFVYRFGCSGCGLLRRIEVGAR